MVPTTSAAGPSGLHHIPVMAGQVLRFLDPVPAGTYVDATAGGGGHSQAVLEAASAPGGDPTKGARVISLDADPEAVARVRQRLGDFGARSLVVHSNFRHLAVACSQLGITAVSGIVVDLGLSSYQLGDPGRGFAMMEDGPLDMRYNAGIETTAADLVNSLEESELADLIYEYGEERQSRRIARAIVRSRPLYTTSQLAAVIERTVGRRGRLHPATRTFQALRIAVNDELGALRDVLPQAVSVLEPGGRLVVISFHSLEDRIVKHFMQREARDCICPPELPVCQCGHSATLRILTKKPVQPSREEVAANPRSRSAKLRAAERLQAGERSLEAPHQGRATDS